MSKIVKTIILIIALQIFVFANENNDFYDNEKTFELKTGKIIVAGEISNPGYINLKKLRLRSVIVKEAKYKNGKVSFEGSYRYDGYSLFDILKERYLDKKNKKEFSSVVDLLIMIENDKGERVVLSWGELYYPVNLHRIIIATRVSPIIPTKTKEKWPIPKNSKLVFANDLVSERNIENPTKITIISAPVKINVNRKVKLYSDTIDLTEDGKIIGRIKNIDDFQCQLNYPSVFYGRGRGFHGINLFKGVPLKSIVKKITGKISKELIRKGYFIVSSVDGYRATISYSELFNRNDNSEFLLIVKGENLLGGKFKIYPSADFFSDRAVKAINRIIFKKI